MVKTFTKSICIVFVLLFILSINLFSESKYEIMDISEIKRGDKGYILTVLKGLERVKVNVEIISVMRGWGPKRSIILYEFKDEKVKHSGTIAGTSGSPLIINGKIAGAHAYGMSYSKPPYYGMATPIKEMLYFQKQKVPKKIDKKIQFIPLEESLLNKHIKNKKVDLSMFKPFKVKQLGDLEFQRVKTPLMINGISDEVYDVFKGGFEKLGFKLTKGPGIAAPDTKLTEEDKVKLRKIVPGDEVGVLYMKGDLVLAASGTVTYTDGDTALLMGHPIMNGAGEIDFPMTRDEVNCIFNSLSHSFKMAAPLAEIGSVTKDTAACSVSKVGRMTKMIPIKVKVNKLNGSEEFNYQIVQSKLYLLNLVMMAMMNSVSDKTGAYQENSMEYTIKIKVKNKKTGQIDEINLKDFITLGTTMNNIYSSLWKVFRPISNLVNNQFAEVEFLGFDIEYNIIPGFYLLQILNVRVLKQEVKPGENVPFIVTFKDFRGKKVYKRFEIKVPEDYNYTYALIGIGNRMQEMYTYMYMVAPYKFYPQNYNQLIKILNMKMNTNDLAIWMEIPKRGLMIDGKELPNLPSSIMSILMTRNEPGVGFLGDRKRTFYKSEYYIYGGRYINVQVDTDPE